MFFLLDLDNGTETRGESSHVLLASVSSHCHLHAIEKKTQLISGPVQQ